MSVPILQNDNAWHLPPKRGMVISIRLNVRAMLAILISILLHLALLWIFAPRLFSMGVPSKQSQPFQVTLGPPQKQETAQSQPSSPPMPQVTPVPVQPKPERTKPKPAPEKVIERVKPVESAKQAEITVPKPVQQPKQVPEVSHTTPKPEPIPDNSPQPLPGEDMQAFIARQKAARLTAQGASKQDIDEIVANNDTPSAGSKRDAAIKENTKFSGTNGLFQIREMGLHHAQFSFKGWKNNYSNARLEIFDVQVPDGSDGKHEVIQKMIEIIRREYSGEFNWDSWRQNRVLVLSARPEDTEALERFLMTEIEWPR